MSSLSKWTGAEGPVTGEQSSGCAKDELLIRVASLSGDMASRSAAARALAEHVGARELLIFVRDPELDVLLPAPGFAQTLPGHGAWPRFVDVCRREERASDILPSPTTGDPESAVGLAADDQAVLVLLGGAPDEDHLRRLQLLLPLLASAFQGEFVRRAAEAQAQLARRAALDARHLSAALDAARAQVQRALHQAEERATQIQQQAAELETIIHALPDAVFVVDDRGRVVRANEPARRLRALASGMGPADLPGDDMLGEYVLDQVFTGSGDEDAQGWPAVQWQALRGQYVHGAPAMVSDPKTGAQVHVLVSVAPIPGPHGSIGGAVAVATDVTELYRLQRQKDEFLSIASHELRTPLTSLKMQLELTARRVAGGQAPASALAPSIERMRASLARMERLVADLVDVSRVEAGKLALRLESLDLVALVQSTAEEVTHAVQREIELRAPDHAVWVMGDAERLAQVVTNYLTNAAKYSPPDSPIRLDVDDGATTVRVAVHDSGIGIPAAALPHVFDRFYQVEGGKVQSGSQVGLGLGLYICRGIVERHGGALGAESAPGQGSAFWFTLPLAGVST